MPRIAVRVLLAGAVLVLCSVAGAASTPGSSTVVVSMNVPGTTALNTTGCTTGTPGVTSFGVVHANTKAVTSLDCHIEFGASGSTATLQLAQTDGGGSAMWRLADGTPDPAFGGGDGVATANVLGDDVVVGAALGVDDSIYLLVDVGGSSQLRVAKMSADGTTLDGGFGNSGIATTRVSDTDFDRAGIAVQPDGKVLIAGHASNSVRVERLTASGGQDNTFDGDGMMTLSSPNVEQAYALELRPDGRILVGGYSATSGTTMGVLLAQLTSDGGMDPDFGDGDGWVVHWTPGNNAGVVDLALMDDGRIVATGWDMSSAYETLVARFLADGSIDSTFGGGDGIYTHALSADDEGAGVALDAAGRAYITVHRASGVLLIGRMNAAGTGFDPGFGGGLVTPPFGGGTYGDGPRIPVVLPDGSVAVAGRRSGTAVEMAVARYRPDGTLHPDFGTGGVAAIDAMSGANEQASIALLGIDGDLKVAGHGGASPRDVLVWSMHGAPLADYDDATGDDWSTGSASHFGACLRAASAGATGVWTEAGTCTAADGAEWQAVPTTAAPVATTTLSTSTAVAELRFGVRTAPAQAAGTYYAPLTFSVIAP